MSSTIEVVTKLHLQPTEEEAKAKIQQVEFNLIISENIDSTPYLTETNDLTELGVKLVSEILTRGLAANLHGHHTLIPIETHVELIDKILTKAIQEYTDNVAAEIKASSNSGQNILDGAEREVQE